MGAYQGRLACPRCLTDVQEDNAFRGCPSCRREDLAVNVHPVYQLDGVSLEVDQSAQGVFGYRSLLPLREDTAPVSLGEGSTPLIRLRDLGERIGLDRLYVKDETRNPTWSYKDRLAAVAVSHARGAGADTVVVATTGNHGAAVAAYAAAAGLRCVALTLESVPSTMKVLMQVYGAEVVALASGPERWKLMRKAVEEFGWTPMSGLADPPVGSNPFGIDGYKTIAYELITQLERTPDVVVVPTAYGDGLAGICRGFDDLRELGEIETVPRMVAAEALGPYSASLASESETPVSVSARPSVAFSIASPVATYQGIRAIRDTGGTSVVVNEDAKILAGQSQLASAGLYVEASAAIFLPAVAELAAGGEIHRDDIVVCIATSSGLKDVDATAGTLPAVPSIAPDLDDLALAIGEI